MASMVCHASSTYCQNFTPFSGSHIILFSFGIIFLFIFIILMSVLFITFIDLNPNSAIPFAAPQNKINMMKFYLKLIFIFFFMFDYDGEYSRYFIMIMTVVYLILLTQRYRSNSYHNTTINIWICVLDVMLFWVSLCVSIHILMDDGDSDIGLVYIVFELPFVVYTYYKLLVHHQDKLISISIKHLKKDEDVEIYINLLRNLIEQKENDLCKIKLEGLLK